MEKIGILKFAPRFQYRLWGGEKLKHILNKDYQGTHIGESWEISGVPDNETQIVSGNYQDWTLHQLIAQFKSDLVGVRVFKQFGTHFPLLIKFIDAALPLSLQVHPNDDLAKIRHDSLGKNEMWYIMDADEDASLLIGFKEKLTKKSFLANLEQGTLLDKVNEIKVAKEEAYFLPAGRVHAIGKGILLAEIQQTSDVTYRVYDYDRVDKKTGQKRELHVEQALDAMDFTLHAQYDTPYQKVANTPNKLIDTPYFKTRYLRLDMPLALTYKPLDSFKIFITVAGSGTLSIDGESNHPIKKGATVMLPANEARLNITPGSGERLTLLEVSY